MNSRISSGVRVASVLGLLLAFSPESANAKVADAKIALDPSMVTNEVALGNADQLVDEQTIAGDPLIGKGGAPQTAWTAGWTSWQYPLHAFIDLGKTYRLSQVFLYDINGAGDVQIAAGKPFAWTPLFMDKQPNYQMWNRHDVSVETRYVRVSIATTMLSMPEIVLYGHAVTNAATAKNAKDNLVAPSVARIVAHPEQPTMDQFVGLNAFIDDPFEVMNAAGFVREYHPIAWDEATPDGRQKAWAPSAAGGGAWNFDAYYSELKKRGITVSPCIQQSFQIFGGNDNKPVKAGDDSESPRSYLMHADHLYQWAARYGRVRVLDRNLKLAPNQKRVSGLNLLHYYENWNEPDKNWRGREGYFSPYELAAMGSADRDGNRGAMGKTVGIKNADPSAKLVMGGLAGTNLKYLDAMKVWSDWNRGGSFPYDVINVHHYSNAGDQYGGLSGGGISPEADKLREKMATIVAWRDHNVPNAEVWLTEFGYDVNAGSPQQAPIIANYSHAEVQAQWLVRSYLALAASGIDRAAMYMLRDVEENDPTQFASSGLSTKKGEWTKRPSWYYVSTLKNRLRGMRFAGEVATGNPKVQIYRFKNDSGGGAFVVWCPTSDGTKLNEYSLRVAAPLRDATLIKLQNGQAQGVESPLSVTQGVAKITVSESPVFVLVDRI